MTDTEASTDTSHQSPTELTYVEQLEDEQEITLTQIVVQPQSETGAVTPVEQDSVQKVAIKSERPVAGIWEQADQSSEVAYWQVVTSSASPQSKLVPLTSTSKVKGQTRPVVATYGKQFRSPQKGAVKTAVPPQKRKIQPQKKRPFCCQVCQKPCRTRYAWRQHLVSHRRKHKYQCRKCKKGFANAFFSACHQELYHAPPRSEGWETARPGHRTNRHKYERLQFSGFDKQHGKILCFLCTRCGKGLTNKARFGEHMRQHNGDKLFVCVVCQKSFVSALKLKRHKALHAEERIYRCYKCGKNFSRLALLRIHSNSAHTGEYCKEVDTKALVIQKEVKKRPTRVKKADRSSTDPWNRIYKCDICDKSYKHASGLKNHSHVHESPRPFSCDVCKRGFLRKETLEVHKRTHTGEKPYTCDTCGRSFPQASSLMKHQTVHTGTKAYSCDLCNKSFSQSSNLSAHKKLHYGDRPHKCEDCGKCFSKKSGLTVHMRSHTGEKPYQCDVCNKYFSQKVFVDRHKLLHKGDRPFSCDTCQRKFSQKSTLLTHIRTHTGEQPYKCHLCDRSFKQSSGLTVHMKRHEAMETLACDNCGQIFQKYSMLHNHIRTCQADDGSTPNVEYRYEEVTTITPNTDNSQIESEAGQTIIYTTVIGDNDEDVVYVEGTGVAEETVTGYLATNDDNEATVIEVDPSMSTTTEAQVARGTESEELVYVQEVISMGQMGNVKYQQPPQGTG